MSDIICHIGNNNWVFGYVEKKEKFFQIYFIKNIHSNYQVYDYDLFFDALEKLETQTKEDLIYICKKMMEKAGLKGEFNE